MNSQSTTPTFMRSAILGITQILLWGGSYFFMAVIADKVVSDMHWSHIWVVGSLSIAILISGLLAPFVGQLIRKHGGRIVLIGGTILLAVGLVVTACSNNIGFFIAGWAVIGAGMAGCLYDPLFSTVGQIYGQSARSAITQITLISGFAITICWPVTHFVVDTAGWRFACLVYAAINILIVVPSFLWALPAQEWVEKTIHSEPEKIEIKKMKPKGLLRLGASFTVASMIMTFISVELLALLQIQGVSAEKAVILSALIGPAQLLSRAIEGTIGRKAHPYWSLLASSIAVLLGLSVLTWTPSLAWLAIILYGAGNGMRTVVRGTLPLALYGRSEYAMVMGQLARAPLIGQAITPIAAGYVMDHLGKTALLPAMLIVAAINLFLALIVYSLKGGSVAQLTKKLN